MIYIEVLGKYWSPGENIIENNSIKDKLDFHKFISYEYNNELYKFIENQKLKNKWAPNTSKYLQYEVSNKCSINIWDFLDLLKKHMTISERKGVYIVGYIKKTHSESNLTYLKLAKVLEFGTIDISPMYLYRSVLKYINANILYFYEKYKNQKREND